ncbi:hypothetical protein TI39_contig274g00005 [Zymoseptoria brevis]|uniref:F-box domain-containing protein n=1 Tax=Zymoseptoria brevis TaxID=1047168 RepID=A0A0F4GWT1_9PEZI|nr:hypothetical protein TI39_contig274g00005 [Zymoseptoria brevis]
MPKARKSASGATSVVSSAMSSRLPSRAASPSPPRQRFRFFDMPAELRNEVYEELLLMPEPVDLDPMNYRVIHPRLALFLVSRRMHEEAYRVFYAQPLRLFPFHGRFFETKKPLLTRLPARYRQVVNTIELRLGPGWSRPPKCQNVKPTLGLMDCTNLRNMKILVQTDPSDTVFNGFRGRGATEDTYKWFCVDLLSGILEQVPSLETIEIDAWVKKDMPLVTALRRKVEEANKRLVWGRCLREREASEGSVERVALDGALASLSISNEAPRLVHVHA